MLQRAIKGATDEVFENIPDTTLHFLREYVDGYNLCKKVMDGPLGIPHHTEVTRRFGSLFFSLVDEIFIDGPWTGVTDNFKKLVILSEARWSPDGPIDLEYANAYPEPSWFFSDRIDSPVYNLYVGVEAALELTNNDGNHLYITNDSLSPMETFVSALEWQSLDEIRTMEEVPDLPINEIVEDWAAISYVPMALFNEQTAVFNFDHLGLLIMREREWDKHLAIARGKIYMSPGFILCGYERIPREMEPLDVMDPYDFPRDMERIISSGNAVPISNILASSSLSGDRQTVKDTIEYISENDQSILAMLIDPPYTA